MAILIAGVLTQSKEAEGDVIDVEGVSILRGSAITAEGKVISVSNMKANQLRAELTARKLSTEGNQKDLMRRVRVSPPAWPTCLLRHTAAGFN